MSADGGVATRLSSSVADDRGPSWSPDGTRVAFSRGPDGAADVWWMPVTGDRPAWAPDGGRIAFDFGGELHSVAPDGSGAMPLTTAGTSALIA